MDEGRAKVISLNEVLETPVGKFKDVLKTEETTPLEPGEKEYKFYAPGIGLVQDNTLKLVNYTQAAIKNHKYLVVILSAQRTHMTLTFYLFFPILVLVALATAEPLTSAY